MDWASGDAEEILSIVVGVSVCAEVKKKYQLQVHMEDFTGKRMGSLGFALQILQPNKRVGGDVELLTVNAD